MREDKKIIFIVRNIIDFEFSLPLILNTKNSVILILNDFVLPKRYISLINEKKISHLFLKDDYLLFYFFKLSNVLNKVFFKLNLELKFIEKNILEIQYSLIKRVVLNFSITKDDIFIFDHNANARTKKLIKFIRSKFKEKIKIISIPHGINFFKNYMTDIHDISSPKKNEDYKLFDLIICSDQRQADDMEGKKIILEPLVYTTEWNQNLNKYFLKKEYSRNNNQKVLVLHSKYVGNISKLEFERALKILDANSDNLDIKLKVHPRSYKEVNIKNYKSISLFDGYIDEAFEWAEVIIFSSTSSIINAFIRKKPVIWMKFSTSNLIQDHIADNCSVANSPDEFLSLIIDLPKRNLKIAQYSPNNFSDLLLEWKEVILK